MKEGELKQVTDKLQARIDGLQEQLNNLRAEAVEKVHVGYFPGGNQGATRPIATILRKVNEGSAIFPRPAMCAFYPLEERSFCWIELLGKRWPVEKNHDGQWYVTASKDGFTKEERERLAAESID